MLGEGVPSLSMGVAARYIHSHVSIIDRRDFDRTVQLLQSEVLAQAGGGRGELGGTHARHVQRLGHLGRRLATRSLEQVRAMYAELGGQIMDGTLYAPVEKVYPIEQIKAALTHVQRCERSGKILVAPNGML